MAYPSVISTLATPQPTDRLNSPSHSALHQNENTGIREIQTFVGTLPSSAVGTLIYDIRSPDSNGGGHIQTANKGGTGQTNYTKGDVLVGQSSSVLVKLAVGNDNQVLIANSSVAAGVNWGNVPGVNVSSTAAASSVWTRPFGISSTSQVLIRMWGGGGSGAFGGTTNEMGGGGGGGYAEAWYPAIALAPSVLLSIGKGGDSTTTGGQIGSISVFDVTTSILTAYAGGAGAQGATGGGGGGGGGVFFSGSNASGANSGGGGSVFGGDGNQFTVPALQGGGGGQGQSNGLSNPGAGSFYAGGGGGSATSSSIASGGKSSRGGNGGSGSILGGAVASVLAGTMPGGGGGAGHGTAGSSGQGGSGQVIITTFL